MVAVALLGLSLPATGQGAEFLTPGAVGMGGGGGCPEYGCIRHVLESGRSGLLSENVQHPDECRARCQHQLVHGR